MIFRYRDFTRKDLLSISYISTWLIICIQRPRMTYVLTSLHKRTPEASVSTNRHLLLGIEDLGQTAPHNLWALCGVDTLPYTLLLVVLDDRASLAVESVETLAKSVNVVV